MSRAEGFTHCHEKRLSTAANAGDAFGTAHVCWRILPYSEHVEHEMVVFAPTI